MKKKKILKIFWMSVTITLGICLLGIGAGILAYNKYLHVSEEVDQPNTEDHLESNKEPSEDEPFIVDTVNENLIVLGTDVTGTLTDVIFVVHFDSKTNDIDVISIPRDTYVIWDEEQKQHLKDYHSWVKESKINEMTSWSSIKDIKGTVIREVEKILGVQMDHYVIVNLDAFRQIVDAVDGVDLNVPVRMKHDDYSQGLHIDLYPGQQHLDGNKAEQFVRFRSYPNGDVDRIKAQHMFLEALAQKVLSPKIITQIPEIVSVVFNTVKTDISLFQVSDYYPYLENLNMTNIHFHTLPGEGRKMGGPSYFFKDLEGIEEMVNEIFFRE